MPSSWRWSLAVPLICLAACVPPAPQTSPTRESAEAAARDAIRTEQSLDVASIPARNIAVPPMAVLDSADTTVSPLAYGLADLLATDLARSSQLTVVERIRMDALLRELQLVSSGAVDSTTAPRVGKLAGARRLVVGALRGEGNDVILEARLADVSTGGLESVISARAPLDRILEAEVQLAFQIFDHLGITLTPGERAAIEAQATKNVTALLAYSRGVRDETAGQYESAAANYRAALVADPSFSAAQSNLHDVAPAPAADAGTGVAGRAVSGQSLSRAVQMANVGVNASLADVTGAGEGASGSVGQSASTSQATTTKSDPVITTIIIPIKQVP